MAKYLLLSILLYCTIGLSCTCAKVWRVNNNQGIQADFINLQAAHNGAAAGDTVYLEGSPESYGNLNGTKKLVIIGPGYLLAENNVTPIDVLTARVGTVQFSPGSAGSVVMGVDFNGGVLYIQTTDILIIKNKFSLANGNNPLYYGGLINLQAPGIANVFILQNLGLAIEGGSYSIQGLLIKNNFFMAYGDPAENTARHCLALHEFTPAIVQNNIFRRGMVTGPRSVFTNNIMVAGGFTPGQSQFSNNLGNATQFGSANGNQSNVSMAAVFSGTGSPDDQWQLKPGSPATGAGYGSTAANPVDAGMFWGNTAYRLSGLPGIPVIYDIQVQAIGSNADPIKVTLKVKSTQ